MHFKYIKSEVYIYKRDQYTCKKDTSNDNMTKLVKRISIRRMYIKYIKSEVYTYKRDQYTCNKDMSKENMSKRHVKRIHIRRPNIKCIKSEYIPTKKTNVRAKETTLMQKRHITRKHDKETCQKNTYQKNILAPNASKAKYIPPKETYKWGLSMHRRDTPNENMSKIHVERKYIRRMYMKCIKSDVYTYKKDPIYASETNIHAKETCHTKICQRDTSKKYKSEECISNVSKAKYSQSHLGWHFRLLTQSSKLKARTSLFTKTWHKRRSSFELWTFENVTASGIGCTYFKKRHMNEVYLSTEEIHKKDLVAPHSTPHHINHWRPKETL